MFVRGNMIHGIGDSYWWRWWQRRRGLPCFPRSGVERGVGGGGGGNEARGGSGGESGGSSIGHIATMIVVLRLMHYSQAKGIMISFSSLIRSKWPLVTRGPMSGSNL